MHIFYSEKPQEKTPNLAVGHILPINESFGPSLNRFWPEPPPPYSPSANSSFHWNSFGHHSVSPFALTQNPFGHSPTATTVTRTDFYHAPFASVIFSLLIVI